MGIFEKKWLLARHYPWLTLVAELELVGLLGEFWGGWLISLGLTYMSNEKSTGWLGYIGDYTTQLYRDFKNPL